jgi:hypothetical protein
VGETAMKALLAMMPPDWWGEELGAPRT